MGYRGEKKKILLFTVYVYFFMIVFAVTGTMFSTALPRIIDDYQLSFSQAGLFSVFTSLGNLGAMAVTGWLGDRFPKSRMMGAVFLGMGNACIYYTSGSYGYSGDFWKYSESDSDCFCIRFIWR